MPTSPEKVAEVFAAHPEAGLVLIEMGHAYGKAKFSGHCKVTGIHISPGAPIRHLAFASRDGRVFDGYVPTKTAELLAFRGGGATDGNGWSHWHPWTPAWLEGRDLASMEAGTTIHLMKDSRGGYTCTTQKWSLEVLGDGTRRWNNHETRGKSTDAMLSSTLRRVTDAVVYRFEAPWKPSWRTPADVGLPKVTP